LKRLAAKVFHYGLLYLIPLAPIACQDNRPLKENTSVADTASITIPEISVHKADTIEILPYDSAIINTDNGSMCICSIQNPGGNQGAATVANIGAQDSIKFDDGTAFNGVHAIRANEQLIATANFRGAQLVILNLSMVPDTKLLVAVLCITDGK